MNSNTKTEIRTLENGQSFSDGDIYSDLENAEITLSIIGDHVYSITDSLTRVVIAADVGNGNGIVIDVVDYGDIDAYAYEKILMANKLLNSEASDEEADGNIHYCVVCCCDTEHDEENECVKCGSALSDLVAEQEVLNFKNEELAYENKMMAEALESLGFTQENISVIKSGEFIPQIVSDEKFKAYAVGLFTCDGENGAKDYNDLIEGKSELSVWQPFEYWSMKDVASEVENTYDSLKQYFTPTLVRSEESETQWCEQCAMEVEVDEHENCINCGQPTNQKLEKFECDECGCFFMVADRDDFVCPNCEGNEDEENTFECEGCGRTLPESEMSDVMEMAICNRCEDGMDEFKMLDIDVVSIEDYKVSDSWELLKKETKEVFDSGCTGRGLECLINNHDLLK